jgi:NAD-dependent deacetylase
MADQTGLLIIVGTSGSTNLPNQVAMRVYQAGGMIIDINLEPNPFSQMAEASGGYFLQYPSGTILPELVKALA